MPRAAKVEALEEYVKCSRSFEHFLRYCKITDTNRGVIDFEVWPHLVELSRAWSGGESTVTGKSRQNGLTWLAAFFSLWQLEFSDNARILAVSLGEKESREFMDKVKRAYATLPEWLRFTPEKSNESTFAIKATGSEFRALPSTENAGRGFQARTFFFDEFAFHPFAGDNYAAARSTIADGIQYGAAMHLISTGNGPTGMFHDLWFDDGVPYRKFFVPWNARPDRDEEWYERERRAYLAMGKSMFFQRENAGSVDEMFSAFVGLVYDLFRDERHVREAEWSWEDSAVRVLGVDPGQGDPFAMIPIGERWVETEQGVRRERHQFDEFYEHGAVSLPYMLEYITEWHARAPFHAIVVDGAEGTLIETLRARGLPVWAATKERRTGIALVRSWLENGTFTVGPHCESTLREYKSYRWATRRSPGEAESYTTSTPIDHHGDAMDATRYALMALAEGFEETPAGKPRLRQVEDAPPENVVHFDPLLRRGLPSRRSGPDYRTRRAR